MREAIVTRYLASTDTRGSRIIATCGIGRATVAWRYEDTSIQNHERACKALQIKLARTLAGKSWKDKMVGGAMHTGGVAFVFVEDLK